jgi:hypothetical protein
MPDLPSRLDYRDIGRAKLAQANEAAGREKWDVRLADTDGATESLVIGLASAMAWHVTMALTEGAASVFLDACSEGTLDRWGVNNYQEPRKPTVQAVGYLLLSRPAQTITPAVIIDPPVTTTTSTVDKTAGATTQTSTVPAVPTTTTEYAQTSTKTFTTNPDGSTEQTQELVAEQVLTSTDPSGTGTITTTTLDTLTTPALPQGAVSTPEIVVDNELPAGTIELGTKFVALDGTTYRATDAVSFAEGQTEALVRVQAELEGKTSQQGTNTITAFVNNEERFDDALTVTNPEPTAGGEPVEGETSYRERLRLFWNAARRSTLGALVYRSIATPGVDSASASEIILPLWDVHDIRHDLPEAHVEVDLSLADSSGVSNQALSENVATELRGYKAGGIDVVPQVDNFPQMTTVVLRLTFKAGVNTTTLTGKVRTALVEKVNTLGVNRALLLADLDHLLTQFASSGLVLNDQTIVEPTTDIQPTPGKTIRTQLDMVLLAAQV